MTTDPRLPTAPESERYLLTCIVSWPERAPEIIPLVMPTDFVDDLHQKLWRRFRTQLTTVGQVDVLAAAKQFKCSDCLLGLGYESTTSVHAPMHAEKIREAALARRIYDIAIRTANAILNGRPADSTLASLHMALEGFEQEAVT